VDVFSGPMVRLRITPSEFPVIPLPTSRPSYPRRRESRASAFNSESQMDALDSRLRGNDGRGGAFRAERRFALSSIKQSADRGRGSAVAVICGSATARSDRAKRSRRPAHHEPPPLTACRAPGAHDNVPPGHGVQRPTDAEALDSHLRGNDGSCRPTLPCPATSARCPAARSRCRPAPLRPQRRHHRGAGRRSCPGATGSA
jgi:hypothetical protein